MTRWSAAPKRSPQRIAATVVVEGLRARPAAAPQPLAQHELPEGGHVGRVEPARRLGQVQPLGQPIQSGLSGSSSAEDLPEAGRLADLAEVAEEQVGARAGARDDDEGARAALGRQEGHRLRLGSGSAALALARRDRSGRLREGPAGLAQLDGERIHGLADVDESLADRDDAGTHGGRIAEGPERHAQLHQRADEVVHERTIGLAHEAGERARLGESGDRADQRRGDTVLRDVRGAQEADDQAQVGRARAHRGRGSSRRGGGGGGCGLGRSRRRGRRVRRERPGEPPRRPRRSRG